MKKLITFILSLTFLFAVAGCSGDKSGGGSVESNVSIVYGTEKVLQSYGDYKDVEDRTKSTYLDEFAMTAFQNEYESRQLIITPESDVKSFDIKVSDFRCGENVLSKTMFDVRYEYYHMVETIYDVQSEMIPGMYPDALLPLETAQKYKLDKIKAGDNQGVYITVFVPKEQATGVYTGTIEVILNGKTSKTVNASVEVVGYELPDSVSLKTSFQLQRGYLIQGELDNTPEMYNKYIEAMQQFRLSPAQINAFTVNVPFEDSVRLQVQDSVKAAKDPSYSAYAIWAYGIYDAKMLANTLDQNKFEYSLKAYVDKSMEENVNLFEKAYVYMGDLIDEPDVSQKYELCNYVCKQFDASVAKVVEYAIEKNAPDDVVEDLRNLNNVVTGMYSKNLPDVNCYCPMADDFGSTARLEEYKSLREQGKDYWWYTCTLPKIPYPTHHLDDNGISSRVMAWMAKEFEVGGFLMWETAYYKIAMGNQILYGRDLYDNVHRWQDAYGDGFYFYPGRVFELDTPVPSLRLYTIRDGMEDYEALHDLENTYAEFAKEYGKTISADGVLNQLYSSMYSSSQVHCSSQDIESAKIRLGQLLLLAKQGVIISDFKLSAEGRISANIYAKDGVEVKLNGKALTFTDNKCAINDVFEDFTLSAGSANFNVFSGKVKTVTLVGADMYTVYDKSQQVNESAEIVDVKYSGTQTTKVALGQNDNRVTIEAGTLGLNKNVRTMVVGVYLEGSETREVSILLFGRNKTTSLDKVNLRPGYNEIRLDCVDQAKWDSIREAERIFFNFTNPGAANLYFTTLCVVE